MKSRCNTSFFLTIVTSILLLTLNISW